MRILKALKQRPLHGFLAALSIFFLLPLLQLIKTPLSFAIWYSSLTAKPLNAALYVLFSALFGVLIALYIYDEKCGAACVKKSDISAGFGGAVLGFVVGICPACFSLIGVVLPLSGSIFLTKFSPIFTLFAIFILLFSIYRLGGFKDD